ncbi:MAG: hypothetical protein IT307_08110 [Chloroflexi bacterium]|nr:hypothetical protein [Chloroflexota bacterium]
MNDRVPEIYRRIGGLSDSGQTARPSRGEPEPSQRQVQHEERVLHRQNGD